MTIPVGIVSTAVALGAIFAFLGIKLNTPAEQMNSHIVQEQTYHKIQADKSDSMNTHLEHTEELLEAMLRGECLENPRADLVRQGLIQKCKQLGIDR
jgi:hypothetical protein